MAGNGPLPDPRRRRTNKPTIPTTALPAGGRRGRAPALPAWVTLGKAGRAWWLAAWHSPQAAAWGVGMGFEPVVARRAMLEDYLAAATEQKDQLAIVAKMLDLDDRLGLTPKAMAQLRWEIVDNEPEQEEVTVPGVSSISARRARLTGAG